MATTTAATEIECFTVPSDLCWVPHLHLHQVHWDPSKAASLLVFDRANTVVTVAHPTTTITGHRCVIGTEGFASGHHFWALKITGEMGSSTILPGVCEGIFKLCFTVSFYPGAQKDGCSYHSGTGCAWRMSENVPFGPIFGKGAVIGIYLNMEAKTCTFYLNGTRVGTAAGPDVLTAEKYYPAVALYEANHQVVSLAVPLKSENSV